jgi:hypothetical protein
MTTITATYSPDDNKLRLYASSRLDAETFARVKAAGYIWAPKQECFVAPMWTPARYDLAEELAGAVGDEDTSLTERAEARAERFDVYAEKRFTDGERAQDAAASISERFADGQPILIGHHSQRKAERDAERAENAMRRALKAFETSDYWVRRAARAVAAAKYKELPEVRARRIKTLEADLRRVQRSHDKAVQVQQAWTTVQNIADTDARRAMATRLAAVNYWTLPRVPEDKFDHGPSIHTALTGEHSNLYAPRELDASIRMVIRSHATSQAYAERWIEHYSNRLAYERGMLAVQTGKTVEEISAPAPRRKSAKAALPLLNYKAPSGAVVVRNMYHRGETLSHPQEAMTKAEYAKIHDDYKGTRVSADGTHRVRTALRSGNRLVAVFLTDSAVHPIPAPVAAPVATPETTEAA